MKKEFLIIDDDETSIFLLKCKIEKLGYDNNIHTACNGKKGLEFIEEYEKELCDGLEDDHIYLLVFLDINMPIMNGFEFLKSFKEISIKNRMIKPTIIDVFSSSKNPKDIEKIKGFEFVQDYIVKYPDNANLKKIIEKGFSARAS